MSKNLKPAADKSESQVLRKAISILRLFNGGVDGLSLQQIVEGTGYSKTVCHRLVSTLVRERFLSKWDDVARYSIGPDLVALARSDVNYARLLRAAEPALVSIASKTGDAALLQVLDNGTALCIDRRDGDYPIRTAGATIGERLPLHCGGGPMALLSYAPADLVDEILSTPLEAMTFKTITEAAEVRERLEEVQSMGYAVGDEDLFEYIVAIGVPIFQNGRLAAALSVGGIKPRYDAERIKEVARLTLASAKGVVKRLEQGGD